MEHGDGDNLNDRLGMPVAVWLQVKFRERALRLPRYRLYAGSICKESASERDMWKCGAI